ncbi:sodium channel protein Nach-like [Uranotaenia lowii]|uniref:sodium channel protein Nach-like n=1 Tax=Uranotaenia lowii TaxID=190385 RepID=UPI002479A063|nr:sodium channel protein Nach-like [Uranotaenia lowii]
MDLKPVKQNGDDQSDGLDQKTTGSKPSEAKSARSGFKRFQLLKGSLLYQTKEYFENSTLHGVRYIAEEGRPFFEKFMWFSFVATGAVAAIIIIFSLWEKFQTNPTITGLDTDFQNQDVIFPTVMVCPLEAWDQAALSDTAYATLANYEPGSERYEPFLEVLTKLSYGLFPEAAALSANVSGEKKFKTLKLRKLAFKAAIQCEDLFLWCNYKAEDVECCEHFKKFYSEHGFCYSFNGRYTSEEDVEQRNAEINRLLETDKKWGLSFALNRTADVFVHSYDEISGWDFRPQVQWDLNFAIDFLISMKQTYTTEDARQLTIGQRKCIFPDEVKLKYYQDDYTFSGCMKECRIRKCLKFCSCIPPFYAPPVKLPYCNAEKLSCLNRYLVNITAIDDCQHCELGCQNTVYDIEKYSKVMITEATKKPIVAIEYLTWPIIRYKREVLFGWVDLLVSFGGIAGLFLGFSLLSGVEIIYFFTMRACCMLYKNRDELIRIELQKLKQPPVQYDLRLQPQFKNSSQKPSTNDPQKQKSSKDEGLTRRNNRNVITLGLIEQDFQSVKVPSQNGLILVGPPNISTDRSDLGLVKRKEHFERFERLNVKFRPDFITPMNNAPYIERIKPLDRNVIKTKDGILYHGYLP